MANSNIFNLSIFREASAFTKIFLILFISFSSLLVFGFIFILLSIPILHISLSDLDSLLKGDLANSNLSFIKYFQATQSIALFIIPSVILNYILFTERKNIIKTGRWPSLLTPLIILLLPLIMLPIINNLMNWNEMIHFPGILENKMQSLEKDASDITSQLLVGKTYFDLAINILVIAIIPALGEEFFFRGIIQQFLSEWSKNSHLGVIFSSIIFSSIHLQFYGFIPRMALGIVFGYIFLWSNNIWIPVLAHFANNLISVVLQFFNSDKFFQCLNHYTGNFSNRTILLISVLLTMILLFFFRKIYLKQSAAKNLES